MALFTRLDEAGVAAIAAAFGLGRLTAFEALWAGTVNSNFRLVTEAGVFFARVNEEAGRDDVAYEADLVTFLADRGVPAPRPVGWRELDGRLVTVFPWVAGGHREPGPAECHGLGAALARVHVAGADFPRRRASRYSFAKIVERWRGVAARAALPEDVAAALVDVAAETGWLASRAAQRAALPVGVIHGDLFPDNVLYDDTVDELVALIDFEQASDGTLVYDLAVCVCAWTFGADFDAARAQALCAGYAGVRALGREERDGLYVETRAAAMRFTVTRLTDVELNPAAAEETRRAKDFRRYWARMRALRAMGAEGFARMTQPED